VDVNHHHHHHMEACLISFGSSLVDQFGPLRDLDPAEICLYLMDMYDRLWILSYGAILWYWRCEFGVIED